MPSPRSHRRPPRASITAILRPCSICRATGGKSSSPRTKNRKGRTVLSTIRPLFLPRKSGASVCRLLLLQAQRHETQLAVGARDQEQRRFAAILLELVDLGLEIVGAGHRLLRDLDDDIARRESLIGRRRARIDGGDDHAFDGVLNLEAL